LLLSREDEVVEKEEHRVGVVPFEALTFLP